MVETNIQEKLSSYKALLTLFIIQRGRPNRASLFCRKRVFNIKRKSCCNIPPLVQSGPGKNIEASLYIYYDTKNFKKITMMMMEFNFFGKFYYLVQISSSEGHYCILLLILSKTTVISISTTGVLLTTALNNQFEQQV